MFSVVLVQCGFRVGLGMVLAGFRSGIGLACWFRMLLTVMLAEDADQSYNNCKKPQKQAKSREPKSTRPPTSDRLTRDPSATQPAKQRKNNSAPENEG